MREHPLRSILSRLLRGPGESSEVELAYLHRGAPDDQVRIMVSTISHLGKGSFTLSDGETQIPFHRILCERSPIENYSLGETETSSRLKPRPLTRNLPGIPTSDKESKRTPATCSTTFTFVKVCIVTRETETSETPTASAK